MFDLRNLQHLAFALTGVMAFAIPDVPREISVQIQREKLLATEALYESDLARLKRESEAHTLDLGGSGPGGVVKMGVSGRRGSRVAQDSFLTHLQHTMEAQQARQNNDSHILNNINLSSLHLD